MLAVPEYVVFIGVAALAAAVIVALVLVVVLRRRSRAHSAEPVLRRIDLASSAPLLGASSLPEVDASPLLPAPDPSALQQIPSRYSNTSSADALAVAPAAPAAPIAPTAPAHSVTPSPGPAAPILHFDTIQLTPLQQPSPADPAAPLRGPAFDDAQPDADETVIVRQPAVTPDPRLSATDETILSARRRSLWHLETQHGQRVPLPSPMCIVGRRPNPVATHPSAALVTVDDPGKTVSGTHALFELVDEKWLVTDLDSTNGVVVVVGGFETAIPTRTRTVIDGDFFLGDLGVRFVRES